MGSRTRVVKIGQNVRQLAQCFHTPAPDSHSFLPIPMPSLPFPCFPPHSHTFLSIPKPVGTTDREELLST